MLKLPPPVWALRMFSRQRIGWWLGWPEFPGLPIAPLGIALIAAGFVSPIWAIGHVPSCRHRNRADLTRNRAWSPTVPIALPATRCILVS